MEYLETLVIPPELFQIAPILIMEMVLTFRSARFLLVVFRALMANNSIKTADKKFKVDYVAIEQLESYSYGQTLVEILLLEMISLVGVCGVHYTLDVPSGRTIWIREIAVMTTFQLFLHVLYSFFCLFYPDFVTQESIRLGSWPPTIRNVGIYSIFLANTIAHIFNVAFLSAALRSKVIAVALFAFSSLAFRFFDKGLLNLGKALKINLKRQQMAETTAQEVDDSVKEDQLGNIEQEQQEQKPGGIKHRKPIKKKKNHYPK